MMRWLVDTLRSRRSLYVSIALFVVIISILTGACVLIYRNFSKSQLEETVDNQSLLLLQTNLNEVDSLIYHMINVSVSYSSNSAFLTEYLSSSPQTQTACIRQLAEMHTLFAKADDIFFLVEGRPHLISTKGTYYLPIYDKDEADALINTRNINFSGKCSLTSSLSKTNIINSTNDTIELIFPLKNIDALLGFQIAWNNLMSIPENNDMIILLADDAGRILFSTNTEFSEALAGEESGVDLSALGAKQQMMIGDRECTVRSLPLQYIEANIIGITFENALLTRINQLDNIFLFVLLLTIVMAALHIYLGYKPIYELRQHAESISDKSVERVNETEFIKQTMHSLFDQYSQLDIRNESRRRTDVILQLANRDYGAGIERECETLGIELHKSLLCFAILQLDGVGEDPALINRLSRALQPEFALHAAEYSKTRGYILLISGDSTAERLYNAVSDFVCSDNTNVYVGIGTHAAAIEQLCYSCAQAKDALQYAMQKGVSPVLYHTDVKSKVNEDLQEAYRHIEILGQFIRNENFEQSRNQLDKMIAIIRKQKEIPSQLCYEIISCMFNAAKENVIMAEALRSSEDFSYFNVHFYTVDDFVDFAGEFLRIISTPIETRKDQFEPTCIYIQQHMLDPNFSPELLADAMHLSISYLNQLFTSRCGKTVSKYLFDLRHAYAKQQLCMTDITISSLSDLLGYSQPSSFIRTFKREEGMSPGEYRRKYQGN